MLPESRRDPAALHCIYQDEDTGQYRHEITECPVSVLARNNAALLAANDWRLLDRPPFDYDTIDAAFWRKTAAIKAEGDWYSNQVKPKKK